MASFDNGLFGDFSGKFGPVSFYKRYDKIVGRIGKSDVRFKTTPGRQNQQQKMQVVNRFIQAFSGRRFFETSFPAYGARGNGTNRCSSCLLNQAVEGSYPNIRLNYAQVLISRGMLPPAMDAVLELLPNGQLQVQFANNSQTGTASPLDKVILVAYAEACNAAVFSLDAGQRGEGQAMLDVSVLKGYAVETWIGFINADESHVSDSVYLGRVEL